MKYIYASHSGCVLPCLDEIEGMGRGVWLGLRGWGCGQNYDVHKVETWII